MNARDARPEELEDWDALSVEAPGGHVYQSRAWAEHRRRSGWAPRFLVTEDGGRVLALTRSWPWIGGGSAYLPRGPVPGTGTATPADLAVRQIAVATTLADEGIDVVAADPEVPAADGAFGTGIAAAGFRPIEEIQPSRHRVSLPLVGRSEDEVFGEISKSTRQRIRQAERDLEFVVRYDGRARSGEVAEGFDPVTESAEVALDRFYDLLLETGERRQFSFGPRRDYVAWWTSALHAGCLEYLEAWGIEGAPVAGIILYRHGGRLSTVHSGDLASTRTLHQGALHLLRWRAIQLAIREGCTEMDLGGVDVRGSRDEPQDGDPLYGLYQHKKSFGGQWLQLTGAHERVFDARGYALGRLAGALAGVIRR